MDGSANEVVEGGDLLLDVKLVLYKLLLKLIISVKPLIIYLCKITYINVYRRL